MNDVSKHSRKAYVLHAGTPWKIIHAGSTLWSLQKPVSLSLPQRGDFACHLRLPYHNILHPSSPHIPHPPKPLKMMSTSTQMFLGTAATLVASSAAFVAPMAVRSVAPAASASASLRMSAGSDYVATLPGAPFSDGKVRDGNCSRTIDHIVLSVARAVEVALPVIIHARSSSRFGTFRL